MEIFLLFVILFLLFDLESKVSKLNKKSTPNNKKFTSSEIKKLIDKTICINIQNDNISDSYLFNPISNTKGKIKECDEEWILFEYETKKEVIKQYFRIMDVSSIDELKE